MTDIFLSYSHDDEERIKPLIEALKTEGWSVFWDRHIPTGKTWRTYIGEALDSSKCVIVAWSRNSITSKWVTEEADVGQKHGILVPIFIDDVEIPIGFRSIQTADLSNWQPDKDSQNFNNLIKDIHEVLKSSKSTTQNFSEQEPEPRDFEHKIWKNRQKTSKNRQSYKWVAFMIIVILTSFWAYQNWFSTSSNEVPVLSGLVFATKIEANGEALNPGTSFSQDITDLYAVFRADMAPPGMAVNVDNPIEGRYYSHMKVIDTTNISSFGWRWYFHGKEVNNYDQPVTINKNYWLKYSDYRGMGIFGGDFSPGAYTIAILLDGHTVMSSELMIHPAKTNEE